MPSLKAVVVCLFATLTLKPVIITGNPLTAKQFALVKKKLQASIESKYASDDNAKHAEIVIQTVFGPKNLTYYHRGDKQQPVFISFGQGQVGQKIIVLSRGEDYNSQKDKNSFVVLRQQSSQADSYTVHVAYIL